MSNTKCADCKRTLPHHLAVCLCEMSDSMLESTLRVAVAAASHGAGGMGARVVDIEDELQNRAERYSQRDLSGEGAAASRHRQEQEMEQARRLK